MESLVRTLQEELKQNVYTKTMTISVEGVNGSENYILLRGRTKTFYLKQCAQEAVRRLIPDGVRLRNEIDVLYSTTSVGYDGGDDENAAPEPRKPR
jgi:hypothetical protein